MEEIFGKHFSITEPEAINTVIYKVNKTEKEFLDKSPKFTIERLKYSEEYIGKNKKKKIGRASCRERTSNILIRKR